jgi:hypothetical protein
MYESQKARSTQSCSKCLSDRCDSRKLRESSLRTNTSPNGTGKERKHKQLEIWKYGSIADAKTSYSHLRGKTPTFCM